MALTTTIHRHLAPRIYGYSVMIAVAAIINAFVATTYTPPKLESVRFFPSVSAVDSSNAVPLSWTAPGDDTDIGTATTYLIRYSTSTLSEGTWSYATLVAGVPAPRVAGTAESTIVTGLTPKTAYSFGIKSTDDAGNTSALSNVVTVTTACYEAWAWSEWGTCTAGTQSRTVVDQNDCGTIVDRPVTAQSCTCTEQWACTDWSACSNGIEQRTCTDAAVCGTVTQKPSEEQDCGSGGGVSMTTGNFDDDLSHDEFAVAVRSGHQATVRVFSADGHTLLHEFVAFPASMRSGVTIAAGNFGD